MDRALIDSIINNVDLVEIIQERLPLKKAGRNFKTPCPFHNEKTPSFVVSPDKQIFHCFGCGAGGNVITFLMKYEKIPFFEALEILAKKANISLPARRGDDTQSAERFASIHKVNAMAAEFYSSLLGGSSGLVCKRYLKERGVTEETISFFKLGYSPNSWESTLSHLTGRGIGNEDLLSAGLILKREKAEGYYDRFRNRLMFPIFDIGQKVVGFGARALDDSMPKYMNSPETPVYRKGRILYGLNFSKGFIKENDFSIVVEGYLDFIIPFQFGIKNIVATLGTALTSDQVSSLRRLSKTVVVVFDPDTAGEEASLRGLDLLVSMDMNVRIATLPKGYDPDTFVRKYGKDAFLNLIKASKDLFDYKMGLLNAKYNKDGVRGRAAIATLMLPTIARIPNEILKASFVKKLSNVLDVDETALKAEMSKIKPDYSHKVAFEEEAPVEKINANSAEMFILSIVLEEPQLMGVLETSMNLDELHDSDVKEILSLVRDVSLEGKKVVPGSLMGYFEKERARQVIAQAVCLGETIEDKEKVFIDCVKRVKEENLRDMISRVREQLRMAQEENDTGKMDSLVYQYNELLKVLKG